VYIVSDLHLGGAPGDPEATDERRRRGFRMMTNPAKLAAFVASLAKEPADAPTIELVVNGDFVDFLAEEHDGPSPWIPFLFARGRAVETFTSISTRSGDSGDAQVFDALADFVANGHRLTVLLGNHDLELALPDVRTALMARIGAQRSSLIQFLYDGEAYAVGDAIIEHGNQYDPANFVDHDGLRRARERRTRGFYDRQAEHFIPPPGSELVCAVMNPLKARYAFIDLLKPESEPLFALLLALEPDAATELGRIAKFLLRTRTQFFPKATTMRSPTRGSAPPGSEGELDALRTVLAEATRAEPSGELSTLVDIAMPARTSHASPATSPRMTRGGTATRGWIADAGGWLTGKLGLLEIFAHGADASMDQRLRALQQALRALDHDESWDIGHEPSSGYRRAAVDLTGANAGHFKYAIFGHTHHVKDLQLEESGGRYLNTGTWANLMRFPAATRHDDAAVALPALREFVEGIRANDLARYIEFTPTYAVLDVDGGGVRSARVEVWRGGDEP